MAEIDQRVERMQAELKAAGMTEVHNEVVTAPASEPDPRDSYPEHLQPLADLMRADGVTDEELRKLISLKGWYPVECPVEQYQQDFTQFITSTWQELRLRIQDMRDGVPF